MPGLTRRLHRGAARLRAALRPCGAPADDGGAVTALIAVLLSGGVLLGMGALVIDVGRLYAEREEVQSGADAASWRVAEACIAAPATCTISLQTPTARDYAARNAGDGATDAQLCLNGTGCPAWNTAVTCPPLPAVPGSYAEVRTTTRRAGGGTLVPPSVAGALVGSAYLGTRVGACGRVSWGPVATARVLALGISLCDWTRMTNGGATYYGVPGISGTPAQAGAYPVLGLPPATAGTDSPVVATVPLGLSATVCAPPAAPGPRGYAWLGVPDGSCRITVTAPVVVNSFLPLGTTATNCATALAGARTNRQPVLVPIFDNVVGLTTALGAFRVVGHAAFVVTGYTGLLGGLGATVSTVSNGVPALAATLCGLANCIYGYFTRMITPVARPVFTAGGTNFGVTAIGRTG